ncbi:hypothetical protein T4D_827, partial [Trichinella pseudospiralis]
LHNNAILHHNMDCIHHLLKMNKYYNLISEFSFYPRHYHHIGFILIAALTLKHKLVAHVQASHYKTISGNSEDKGCFHLYNSVLITFQKTLNFIIHLIAQLICTQ